MALSRRLAATVPHRLCFTARDVAGITFWLAERPRDSASSGARRTGMGGEGRGGHPGIDSLTVISQYITRKKKGRVCSV